MLCVKITLKYSNILYMKQRGVSEKDTELLMKTKIHT